MDVCEVDGWKLILTHLLKFIATFCWPVWISYIRFVSQTFHSFFKKKKKQGWKYAWISRLLTMERNNNRRQPEERCCAFPESSYSQILPRAALCEMECEMSALNIPAVDYTHYLTWGFKSISPPACECVIKLHSPLYPSPFHVPYMLVAELHSACSSLEWNSVSE